MDKMKGLLGSGRQHRKGTIVITVLGHIIPIQGLKLMNKKDT